METTTPETPTLNSPPPSPKKIPTFLLVICILTFVGSGFGILGSLFSFASANLVSNINSEYREQMETQQTPSFLKSMFESASENSTPAKIREMALVKLVSCLLTLFGAILMLRLKKPGFYLYVAGIVIYIALPIYYFHGFIGAASGIFYAIIGIGFVVMYAVNLKYMSPPESVN